MWVFLCIIVSPNSPQPKQGSEILPFFFCFSHLVFSKFALKDFFCSDWLLGTDIVVGHVNSQVTIKSKNSRVVGVKLVCTSTPLKLFTATHELKAWSSPAARAEEYFFVKCLLNLNEKFVCLLFKQVSLYKKHDLKKCSKYPFHKWTWKAVFIFIFCKLFPFLSSCSLFKNIVKCCIRLIKKKNHPITKTALRSDPRPF